MCGIFGILVDKYSTLTPDTFFKVYKTLFILSESRGKEAAGFSISDNKSITVYKTSHPASALVKSDIYNRTMKRFLESSTTYDNNYHSSIVAIGHSRLVTDGVKEFNENNQPVIKNEIVGIHNGIVTNVANLWSKYKDEKRNSELDSEIIFTLMRRFYFQENTLKKALKKVFNEIYGMTSIAVMFSNLNNLLLSTNNGSLYYALDTNHKSMIFASEYYIVDKVLTKHKLTHLFSTDAIKQVKPLTACFFSMKAMRLEQTSISNILSESSTSKKINEFENMEGLIDHKEIVDLSKKNERRDISSSIQHAREDLSVLDTYENLFLKNRKKVNSLTRCSRCLLPSSFPFIQFDEYGVCLYCNNHINRFSFSEKEEHEKLDQFKNIISRYRKKGKERVPCIVPLSGGRDSCYGLHYIKEELGLAPVTFTYDWGMVTDLARRNISRMCGKLGVENILVSADILRKREYIKKNVLAWLKKPDIGMVPIFMAGDKYFFYYLNKIKDETSIRLSVWLSNRLEQTEFKVGFCGVLPSFNRKWANYLNMYDKIRFASYFLKNYLLNTAYFNTSLIDTIGSYYSYFIEPRKDLYFMYDFVKWDEKIIEDTLINEYHWEKATDTNSSWRIGDGTAPFYNYIYYTIAGFTENDTFRSNQIREGLLSRDDALKIVQDENRPRFESIKWYCNTIGINFRETIERINTIPKLY